MIRLLLLTLTVLATSSVYSQFQAVYIPTDKLCEINIDGDTTDWNWVPNEFAIDSNYMHNLIAVKGNHYENWKGKVIVGWNNNTSRLYILAKVVDDTIVSDNSKFYLNDCFQFAVKVKNEGGAYRSDDKHIVRFWFVNDTSSCSKVNIVIGPKWFGSKESNCFEYNVKNYLNHKHEYVTIYEMSLVLFNEWSDKGIEYSEIGCLAPDKRIRLLFAFDDSDNCHNIRKAEWTNMSGWRWPANSDDFPEFVLKSPNISNKRNWISINETLKLLMGER